MLADRGSRELSEIEMQGDEASRNFTGGLSTDEAYHDYAATQVFCVRAMTLATDSRAFPRNLTMRCLCIRAGHELV